MHKLTLLLLAFILLSGCSSHAPTMQDVRSYCRSLSTESECDMQGNACEEYSQVLLKAYSSASDCRKGCESVQQKMQRQMAMQNCRQLFDAVEGKCNEYCNANYK